MNSDLFRCRVCNKYFLSEKGLRKHEIIHQTSRKALRPGSRRWFKARADRKRQVRETRQDQVRQEVRLNKEEKLKGFTSSEIERRILLMDAISGNPKAKIVGRTKISEPGSAAGRFTYSSKRRKVRSG